MFHTKTGRAWQVVLVVLLLSSLCLSQVAGGGTAHKGAVGGGGGIGLSLSGQLSGIINKTVFAKSVKKNSAKPVSRVRNISKSTVAKGKTTNRPVPRNVPSASDYEGSNFDAIKYQPTANARFDREFANLISQNPEERELLLLIFSETKKSFDQEARKLGRQNDLALVFTFFVSACLTAYHNTPDPSDEATEKVYQVIAQSLSESPDLSRMSNQDKSVNADKLIYISGLVYAGFLSAKQNNDAETMKVYQQLAGVCLESLIGISPDSMKFDKDGLTVNS